MNDANMTNIPMPPDVGPTTSGGIPASMRIRLALGPVMALVVVGVLLIDFKRDYPWFFGFLLATVSTLGLYEYYTMASKSGAEPWRNSALVFGFLLMFCQWYSLQFGDSQRFALDTAGLVLGVSVFVFYTLGVLYPESKKSPINITVTVFGLVYIPFLLSFYYKLYAVYAPIIFVILAGTKCTDIGAYFSGYFFGKRKLAPEISPNKTIEGALGGWLAGFVIALILSLCVKLPWIEAGEGAGSFQVAVGWKKTFLICLFIPVIGQMGDLFESLLKRRYKVKDSGDWFSSFGGVLDLIDSLIFTGLVVYLILIL